MKKTVTTARAAPTTARCPKSAARGREPVTTFWTPGICGAAVIEIIKENAVTFERLANVPFRVWYASNNTSTGEFNDLGTFYTDESGRIVLNGPEMGELGLRDGWFRVQELEPLKGFAKADPDTQEAFVPAGQGHTFRFRNQPLSAHCIWKYDRQHPNQAIEGAVFQIRYLSGNHHPRNL